MHAEAEETMIMPDKDGKGPRKGSYMYRSGKKGKKAGHLQGNCK